LHGYKFVHVLYRQECRCGLFVIEHIIEFLVLNSVINVENEDCQNLRVELKLNQKKYAVGVVYRHPSSSTPNFKAFSE